MAAKAPSLGRGGLFHRGVLRQYASVFSLAHRGVDATVIALAGLVAYVLRFKSIHIPSIYVGAVLLGIAISAWTLDAVGLYRSWRTEPLRNEFVALVMGWGGTALLLAGVGYAFKLGADLSRIWAALWFALAFCALLLSRVALRAALQVARERGLNMRSVVVVGSGNQARAICRKIIDNKSFGLNLRCTVDLAPGTSWNLLAPTNPPMAHPAPRGGVASPAWQGAERRRERERLTLNELESFVAANEIDEVWLALPFDDRQTLIRVMHALRNSTANIRYAPDFVGVTLLNGSLSEIDGHPLINLSVSPMQGVDTLIKRLEDLVCGGLLFLLFSPVFLLIAAAIKLDSKGTVIFKQRRHGCDGREIVVWKFRTMHPHQDKRGWVTQATKNDSRVTRVGAILRRTSLDELPQLINVLQGTMSLVGPRPHAVEHNHLYAATIAHYAKRHKVKPGITGWAQVNGLRGEGRWEERTKFDLEYIENWSIWVDIKIIFLTPFKGLVNKNAY